MLTGSVILLLFKIFVVCVVSCWMHEGSYYVCCYKTILCKRDCGNIRVPSDMVPRSSLSKSEPFTFRKLLLFKYIVHYFALLFGTGKVLWVSIHFTAFSNTKQQTVCPWKYVDIGLGLLILKLSGPRCGLNEQKNWNAPRQNSRNCKKQ